MVFVSWLTRGARRRVGHRRSIRVGRVPRRPDLWFDADVPVVLSIVLAVLSSVSAAPTQSQDLPYATLQQHTIVLHPSEAAFQIPEQVFGAPLFRAYVSRPQLESVKSPVADEWDHPYGAVVNAALPFESCAAHLGTEPFGPGAHSFADLQMRAYVVAGPSKPVLDRIANDGLAAAKGFARDATATPTVSGNAWSLTTIAYTLRFADYAGAARIDFFVREFGPQTAVLVFMHVGPNPRWSWTQPIAEIVDSFAWPGR
jgi:hypothetical protein